MKRDFSALEAGPFDLLVVGGGIYGAWTAWHGARLGLKTALVEAEDWGAGTSQASSKLIHGGLRYLEQYHFSLVAGSLAERQALLAQAPHRVNPLTFLVPVYRHSRVNRLSLKAGLWLYDRLAGFNRQQGLPEEAVGHRRYSAKAMRAAWPHLRGEGLKGGFTYMDGQTDDSRFTLEVVDGAVEAGVRAVNHCRAVKLLQSAGGRVEGAALVCGLTGKSLEVKAKATVAAAGPWTAGLLGEAPFPSRLTKGVHLVLPPLPGHTAMLLNARSDGRFFFVIPFYGRTLVGTTDTPYQGDPSAAAVEPQEVAYLLEEANLALEGAPWTERDLLGRFAGLRTLQDMAGHPSSVSRELLLLNPRPGLLAPLGGKFTSARADALELARLAARLAGRPVDKRSGEPLPVLPWAPCPAPAFGEWLAQQEARGRSLGLDGETAHWTARRHGSRVERLFGLLAGNPELAARLHPALPFCRAEAVVAARHEMAMGLPDLLRRRTPSAILAPWGKGQLEQAAAWMGQEMGWSDEEKNRQAAKAGLLALSSKQ